MEKNFFEDVYEVVKLVPKGRVTSYGAIAKYLGSGISARMVGWAMNACHGDNSVPAHRVVNSAGLLTGKNYFGIENEMQKLLEAEGVGIANDKVQNFKDVLWEPMRELI